jgi:TP901 family phage tail tape measure protein
MSRFVLTAQLQLQAPNNVAQVVRQIQSQLNGVNINLNVQNSAQAQRQLQQITAQTQSATSAADRMGRAFAISIRRFAAFSIATRAVGLFTSTLSDAVQTAIDFEREMIKVSQVTGEAIGRLKFLTKAVTDLSTGFGVSSQELLNTSQLLLQAGISAKDTEVALKTLAKAALAPNFDSLSETTEGAIAILAQFQEGVGSLEKQLGSINAVAGAFAVEAGDLIDVIRRTGGVFKASGGDLNELIALFTSVRATTRESAESIGTGLRTIFTRIQRPKTIEYLKEFGVELVDLEGKFVGPFEAVKRLSSALAGLGEGDITFIRIAEELGGFRQIGKVLPLLQQFSTAQSALNVAQKAGNSLTKDAETAQQALAVRIIKVKEEFLALIRGMTETTTFQVMANTALSLASALIRIGEAIKPLLPLLAAVAAVNFAKGISGFAGGLMRGMQSGRTYSTGGKVHHFARGGMVPGSGNRDTVPAMLQPGEFVIRKSSVNKLGAGNLAAMNENGYEAGGIVKFGRGFYGNIGPDGRSLVGKTKGLTLSEAINAGFSRSQLSGAFGKQAVDQATGMTSAQAQAMAGRKKGEDPNSVISGARLSAKYGVSFLEGALSNFSATINQVIKSGNATGVGILQKAIAKDGRRILPGAKLESPNASVAFLQPDAKEIFDNEIMDGLPKLFDEATKQFGAPLKPGKVGINELVSNSAVQAIKGYFFEGFARRVSQNLIADSQADKVDSIFDFTGAGNTQDLKRMFGGKFVDPNEFKVSPTTDNIANAISKAIAIRGESGLQFFASGGMAKAPLVDDIINASGTVMPRPSSAIASLIRAGGGAIDIDRTLKRTLGDQAYGRAKTSGQQSAALDKYFRDPAARLRDVTSAPLTAFGKELQAAIKSGQLQPGRLSIVSKSQRVPGVAEYLSRLFGIPLANMIFTQGGSKQPAMDALRTKGPRANRVARFATGGGVGTDTIPALLTPGEFVVNRSSAQRIGYGNLNRMNKVGRYAKGGIVKHFSQGGLSDASSRYSAGFIGTGGLDPSQNLVPFDMLSRQARSLSIAQQSVINSSNKVATANNQQTKSIASMIAANKMSLAATATSLIAGFLPAVDNNSGAMLRLTHSLLGLITTIASVGFALEAFGVKLTKQGVMDFLGGKGNIGNKATEALGLNRRAIGQRANFLQSQAGGGMGKFAAMRQAARESKAGFAFTGGGVGKFTAAAGKVVQGLVKLAGPLVAVAGSAYAASEAFKASIEAIYNFEGRLKMAVEAGDVNKAKAVAGERATFEGANAVRGVGATAGAGIGFILGGPIGAAIGAALGAGAGTIIANGIIKIFGEEALDGLNTLFGGNTRDSAIALAAAQAGAVKTQKELDKAQKVATNAMDDFQKGAISASDALTKIRSATSEVQRQETRAAQFAATNLSNRASDGFTGRNIASALTLGMVESSSQRNQRLGQQSAEQLRQASRFQSEAFQMETGARTATIRSGFARGRKTEDIRKEAMGDLQRRMSQQRLLGNRLQAAGDEQGAAAAFEAAAQFEEQIKQVDREMASLEKEVARAKAAFDALNLGLRGPTATATAMSASMDRFVAGFEVGGSTFVANTEFLAQAAAGAAQAMDSRDIKQAMDDVSNNLKNMGVDPAKFRANTEAFIQAQKNYNQAFKNIKDRIKGADFTGMSADTLRKEFAKELTAGLDGEAKRNLTAIIEGMELSDAEVDAILGGNLQVFGDKLGEASQKQFEQIMKIAQERQKAEQALIGFINKRAESERKLAAAQKEAVDLYMEGRDIQAKYGGRAVSTAERRSAIIARANAGASAAGLGNLRNGSVGELRNRNTQILAGFGRIEERRRRFGGMTGTTTDEKVAGVEANITQQNLEQAQKDQIQTIRDLIKLQEDELKILQEKNRMEKESLESLISGDIEKFFEQQAALGAQAAIATGDRDAANIFGAKAVGDAFKDIQRQQEAGVQSLFGQRLGGPGGLAEQAAGAALGARGIMDPRAAQMLAGTTAAEEAIKGSLRELGGLLGETGAVGAAMAAMEVQTATVNINNATVKLSEIEAQGNAAAKAAGMFRGGVVYANRGIFVPRGTDTVPAMLTPGEFVVRREAVNRGNNLQLLRAINNGGNAGGFARGGKVGYYNNGGSVQYKAFGDLVGNLSKSFGIDPQLITNLGNVFNGFVNRFNDSIKNLQNTKVQVQMSPTTVNVNFTGANMLNQISDQAKSEIISQVVQKLKSEYGIGSNGKFTENPSNLARPGQGY